MPQNEEAVLLSEPREGVPNVITTSEELSAACEALCEGTGPIAADAERASGFRYSSRAYLVQLRRAGAGSFLIDPIPFKNLDPIQQAVGDQEWVFHAADQDLPCLAEIGIQPAQLFDTEIAARLLGYQRFGLAALCAEILGYKLAKEHSAADWSTRPLPLDWLRYATLDVELLLELRSKLIAELEKTNKLPWAQAEFAAVLTRKPKAPSTEPWRKIPGSGKLKNRKQLAVLREIWRDRDDVAHASDLSPGKIIRNADLVAIAASGASTRRELLALPFMRRGKLRDNIDLIALAVRRVAQLTQDDYPTLKGEKENDFPNAQGWNRYHPERAVRLHAIRECIAVEAQALKMIPENLLAPRVQRLLAWHLGADTSPEEIAAQLGRLGARPWQAGRTALELSAAIAQADLELQ